MIAFSDKFSPLDMISANLLSASGSGLGARGLTIVEPINLVSDEESTDEGPSKKSKLFHGRYIGTGLKSIKEARDRLASATGFNWLYRHRHHPTASTIYMCNSHLQCPVRARITPWGKVEAPTYDLEVDDNTDHGVPVPQDIIRGLPQPVKAWIASHVPFGTGGGAKV